MSANMGVGEVTLADGATIPIVNAEDAARSLDKAVLTLEQVSRHLHAAAEANAALHLAGTVLPSPLSAAVDTTAADLRRTAERFRAG